MLRNWKKNKSNNRWRYRWRFVFVLFVVVAQDAWSLPDIPSFLDCEDIVFNAGFQNDSLPSNGKGGQTGAQTRTLFSNGSMRNYNVYVPLSYSDNIPLPLLVTYHGAGGAGTAPLQAQFMRDFWQSQAELSQFIVMSQEATGASGGWVPSVDFSIFSNILSDLYAHYNIEKNRIYGYGFSAGGHVMHTLMLFNSNEFAGYAVSAGVLEAHAGLSAPANASRNIPVFVSIGTQDSGLINFVHSNHTVFNQAGWVDEKNYWLDEFTGGHQIDLQIPQKAWNKLCTLSKLD